MARLAHALLLGLVGAVIVHIAVLLLVPVYSQRSAWSEMEAAGGLHAMVRLDGDASGEDAVHIPSLDPLFTAVGCRFDLRSGVVRVSSAQPLPYWSASLHDRRGQNLFAFTDRSSTDGLVDFVIATHDQMIALRNDLPRHFERSVFVEADIEQGMAVVRAFVPDESWRSRIATDIAALDCTLQPL